MPSFAAHRDVALELEPHQIRSRNPAAWGSRRSRPGGMGNMGFDLLALLDVESLTRLIILERRTLEIHAELRRPPGRRVGTRTPPDPLAQSSGMGLEAQQTGRIGKHGPRIGLREAIALQQSEEHFGLASRHVGVRLAVARR